MKYVIAGLCLVLLAGCRSGIDPLERLGWYVPYVPKDLAVKEFYETPSPSMDHDYLWKIRITKSSGYKKFERQFTKGPSNASGVNHYSEPVVFDCHPGWWKKLDFSKGTLYKHRVKVVGGGGQLAYVFAFIDRKAGYLYIQAF